MCEALKHAGLTAIAIFMSLGFGCHSTVSSTPSSTLAVSVLPQSVKKQPTSILYMEVPRRTEGRLLEIRSTDSPEAATLIDDVCRVFAEHNLNHQINHYVRCHHIPSVWIWIAIEHGDGVRSMFRTSVETLDSERLSSGRYYDDVAACAMVKLVGHHVATTQTRECAEIVRKQFIEDSHDREWCQLTEDDL